MLSLFVSGLFLATAGGSGFSAECTGPPRLFSGLLHCCGMGWIESEFSENMTGVGSEIIPHRMKGTCKLCQVKEQIFES